MPSGSIRDFLIVGFVISTVVLMLRKLFVEPGYVEFFMILAGLIAGHLPAKWLPHVHNTTALNFFNHAKGLVVPAAVFALAMLLLTGHHEKWRHIAIALSCVIRFYFGSRSPAAPVARVQFQSFSKAAAL